MGSVELAEYDALLEQIASTDVIDAEWSRLRDIIKAKIEKNIAYYLANPPPDETVAIKQASMLAPRTLPNGGLKLPPFAPRPRLESNPNEAPKHRLTAEEAAQFKQVIFDQLEEFEGPPFTIQRVCELCLRPEQYKFIGKYLRAVEKSLLVTSTSDAFPLSTSTTPNAPGVASMLIGGAALSVPSTPIFSPIPFLHGDARRSQSRSPPPSPLILASDPVGSGTVPQGGVEGYGLVDELDDTSPGHLSDHLHPISSTTTTTPETKPLIGSLEQRFVRSSPETATEVVISGEGESDNMVLDEVEEDKENKSS